MCAVVGAVIKMVDEAGFERLKKVIVESKIRGLHATGISYVKEEMLHTMSAPVPADVFVDEHMRNLSDFVNEDGNLYMIAHCRYSTSDLEFNQPIQVGEVAVAHNGVITQEPPEQWTDLYGYECITKNDSELLAQSIAAGKSPLKEWAFASISCVAMSQDKTLTAFRNGKRPLYLTYGSTWAIITSTKDIAERAGLTQGITTMEMPMETYFTMKPNTFFGWEPASTGNKDLQHV